MGSIPLLAVIITSIIAIILLSFGYISETFAIIMILTLLSVYILDQVLENIFFKEKFQNVLEIMEKNTDVTESIHQELNRKKISCELIDPCQKYAWEFEEELLWYNAPLVLAEDEIFNTIRNVYSSSEFKKAKYIFFKGKSINDKNNFEKQIKRYNKIENQLQKHNKRIINKMSARIIDGIAPRISFFLGKKRGFDECIIYIWEKPFAIDAKKGEHPGYVFIIREKELIRRLRTMFNNKWSKGDPFKYK
jgi:uncharacterized membrane protein